MKRILFSSLLFLFILSPLLAAQIPAEIELVESIPVETSLDNPDIRNTLEVWLELIEGAHSTIDLEQFYLSHQAGESLDQVITALQAAARRGVKVRILADARMYKTYPVLIDSLGKWENITARLIDFGTLAGGIQHAKYMVIDGESLFLGSQNFDWRALTHIHELGIRIRSAQVVSIYQELFELDWRLADGTPADTSRPVIQPRLYETPIRLLTSEYGPALIQPTYSPRALIPDTTLWCEEQIVRLLDGAQREIALQFLSYSPRSRNGGSEDPLDGALRRAAARNVRVRLLVADWQKGSRAEAALKELAQVPNIEVCFSVIPEWSGGYISYARVEHCKYILVDREAFWLGTSNAARSYFHTSRNAGMTVRSAPLAGRLLKIFNKSWESPYAERIDPGASYEPRRHDGE